VIRRRITLALALLFIALAVEARIGGGQTYSGSSSSPSSAPPPRSSPPPSHDYDSHHDYTPQRDVPSPSSSTSSSSIKSGGSSGDSDPAIVSSFKGALLLIHCQRRTIARHGPKAVRYKDTIYGPVIR